jgi:hypothetical protein
MLFLFFLFKGNPEFETVVNIICLIFIGDMFLKFDEAFIILIVFVDLDFKILIMNVVFEESIVLIAT